MTTALINRAKDEEGLALLVAVILLLMISAIGLTALQSAQDEAAGSGRSRRKTATLSAAISALELVERQLDVGDTGYPNADKIDLPNFMTDQWGGTTAVRTGTADTAAAQDIKTFKSSADGMANIGAKNTMIEGLYRANVVATDSSGGVVEVQAQYRVSLGSGGNY